MTVIGIGTDIVRVARMQNNLERYQERFAARILTPAELEEFRVYPKKANFLAKRFAGDCHGGLVDFDGLIAVGMPIEHDPGSTKGVRDNAVGSRFGIGFLNSRHSLGVREIPGLAAPALLQPSQHELSSHRTVT